MRAVCYKYLEGAGFRQSLRAAMTVGDDPGPSPPDPQQEEPSMPPKTLLEMAGADLTPPALAAAVLVLINCQNEYGSGDLPLVGVDGALDHLPGQPGRASCRDSVWQSV